MRVRAKRLFLLASLFLLPMQSNAQLHFPSALTNELDHTVLGQDTRKVVIVIHGWQPCGGSDNAYASGPFYNLSQQLESALLRTDWKLVLYRWEQDADTVNPALCPLAGVIDFPSASVAAARALSHGTTIGQLLNELAPDLRQVHFVAHSAGTWAAYAAAEYLLALNPYITIQITLLDGFVPANVSPGNPLNTGSISSLASGAGHDRIFRLENYHGTLQCGDLGGLGQACDNTFSGWRPSTDINLVTSFNTIESPFFCYHGHDGPIQFFTDTVPACQIGANPAACLVYASSGSCSSYQYSDYGWSQSLFSFSPLLPHISANPQDQSVVAGGSVLLTITASSSQPLFYQWFHSGQAVAGATSASYSFVGSSLSAGDYVAEVSNQYGFVFSEKAVVSVNNPSAPIITSVSPRTLNAMPLGQTQLITITGTGFMSSSRLTFNDGVNPPYTDKVPASWTPTQLTYNIAVGPNPATWTVKVVNGTPESLPYSFYVVSGTKELTSLGVSGPAYINENGSGQFTAIAYFSDGSQQNVTSSATWNENSSVTTISSSGLLSAGSVDSDTTVTVTASYTTGGIAKSATANVTVVNSSSCGSTLQETILNGNFANNGNNWTLTGSFHANADFTFCNSCPGYAWFANADGTGGNNLSGTLSQTITIPANATSATLGYYYRITTSDSTTTAFDHLLLNLVLNGGSTLVGLDDLSNVNANSAYAFRSFDITAYKGQTITVRFTATTDGSGPTVFRVDDVSVIVSAPNPITPVLFGVGGPTNVAEGSTAQYSAIVVNCDGTIQPVTPTWSENSSATTISSSGLLTAGSVSGDTPVTITATYGSFPPLNYPITVVNSAASFSYLAISGPSSINENSSGQFTATAIFSDGSSQSVSPNWTENSTATSISTGGMLTVGEVSSDTTVTVSASYTIGSVTHDASQQVLIINSAIPPTLTALIITGPNSINENGTEQYTAVATFSDGSSQSVDPTWSVNSAVVSISIFGLLSAGPVTSNVPAIVSASYTVGGVTRDATRNVLVIDTDVNPIVPYEAKWALPLNTFNARTAASTQDGGLIVFGDFTGAITAGGQLLTANGNHPDIYAAKFDTNNQVVWVKQYGGPNEETVSSCARHPAGGWVISGTFEGTASLGSSSPVSAGDRDAFLARLDEDGNVLWARRGGGTSVDYGKKVAVDGVGNCFLIGVFTTSATFDGGAVTLNASGTAFDLFVAKYTSTGDFQWAKSAGGPQYDDLYCAGVDTAGNVYVGGIFVQSTTFGPYTLTNPGNPLDSDAYLAKFSPSGDVLWAKRFGQSSGDFSTDSIEFIGVKEDGTCFFAGSYQLPMLVEGQSLPGQTAQTAFVGKVNNAGTLEWLRAIPATSVPESGLYFSHCSAHQGLPTSDGGVIVCGSYLGKISFGSTTVTNATLAGDRLYFAKLDASGTPLWVISADSPGFAWLSYFGSASGERARFTAEFSQAVSLPGISPITATAGETVLVEIGPQEIVGPPTDTDGDGMPDDWELAHGLNPNSSADATLDPDGDGLNNLAEFQAGTDPKNSTSAFRITAVEVIGADIRVSFTSVSGKYYWLERCDFIGGPWVSIVNNVPGNNSIQQATDIGGASRGCAFYRVRLNQSPNPALADSDGDGLPDSWMQLYFGHATGQAADKSCATDDADGDGMSNLQEYLTGTNPTNSASAFRILSVAQDASDLRLTWLTAGGHTNVVQAASNLAGSYSDVSSNIIIGNSDTTANYLDLGAVTNSPARFYRVRLVP